MKHFKKAGLLGAALLLGCLFFAGCQSSHTAYIPSDTPPLTRRGLETANGDCKESGAVFEDGPVAFQDPVMEEMLRNLLGKPEGEVLRSDLQAIHAIYWRGDLYWSDLQSQDGTLPVPGSEEGTFPAPGQPETLADLALCDNLQWMEFSGIELPSLAPLSGLPQLEHIDLGQVLLSEERLDELAQLPALKELSLDFRDMAEDHTGMTTQNDPTGTGAFILPLADRLTHLCIDNKLTWSSEVLSQLTNLEYLRIDSPQELGFLASMPKLQALSLSNANLSDWSALGQASGLENLLLLKCTGVTLDDLRPLPQLKYLTLVATDFTPKASRQEISDALPGLLGLSY